MPDMLTLTLLILTAPAPPQTSAEFEDRLRRAVRIDREAGPLRGAASAVAATQEVTVQLDPRVDPRAVVTPPPATRPLLQLVDELARQAGATARPLGRTILLTPIDDTDRIATLAAARADDLSDRGIAAAALLRPFDLSPRPAEATPRELWAAIAAEFNLTPAAVDLPEDLWRVDLRGVTACEAMAFVLVPSGRSFEWDGERVRVVERPAEMVVRRVHRIPPRRDPAAVFREVRTSVAAADVQRTGRTLSVVGTAADQEAVARILRPPPKADAGGQRYTLRVDRSPAGPVVTELARKGVPIRLASERFSPAELRTLISLDLSEATLEELATAVAGQIPGAVSVAEDAGFRIEPAGR